MYNRSIQFKDPVAVSLVMTNVQLIYWNVKLASPLTNGMFGWSTIVINAIPRFFKQRCMLFNAASWSWTQCMAEKLVRRSKWDLQDSIIEDGFPASATANWISVRLHEEGALSTTCWVVQYSIIAAEISMPTTCLGNDLKMIFKWYDKMHLFWQREGNRDNV